MSTSPAGTSIPRRSDDAVPTIRTCSPERSKAGSNGRSARIASPREIVTGPASSRLCSASTARRVHFASWNTRPSVRRRPVRTTLTPWRIGAADQPRFDSHRSVTRGEDQALTLPDDGRRRPRLRTRSLFDDDELAAGVVRLPADRARSPPGWGTPDLRRDHGATRSSRPARSSATAASNGSVQRRDTGRANRPVRRATATVGPVAPPSCVRSGAGVARTRRGSRRQRRGVESRSTGICPGRSGTAPCRSSHGSDRLLVEIGDRETRRGDSTAAGSAHSRGRSARPRAPSSRARRHRQCTRPPGPAARASSRCRRGTDPCVPSLRTTR